MHLSFHADPSFCVWCAERTFKCFKCAAFVIFHSGQREAEWRGGYFSLASPGGVVQGLGGDACRFRLGKARRGANEIACRYARKITTSDRGVIASCYHTALGTLFVRPLAYPFHSSARGLSHCAERARLEEQEATGKKLEGKRALQLRLAMKPSEHKVHRG